MLRLEGLSRRFGDTVAVDHLSLEVRPGEILSLLGPSGCGKTTTLRMIAGFETPTSGRVWLRDREVTALSPQRREVGMVFQSYALFPHLNVGENVAFGLESTGVARAEIAPRVQRVLARVELPGLEGRRVQQLSGGQQQRVALARALAPEPPLLLLDEPLSNLDAALRERTRVELRALLKRLGITAVFVTHDQEEAFALSDRIALLQGGRLQQLGTPEALYREPANPFVAGFLGRANWLPATVAEMEGDTLVCRLEGGICWAARSADGAPGAGAAVRLMVRPEGLRITPESGDGAGLAGQILDRRFAGPVSFYRVALPDGAELLVTGGAADAADGERVTLRPAPDMLPIAFPAEA